MKKILYYFSLVMLLLGLTSCSLSGESYDVSYFVNYKLVAKVSVRENKEVAVDLDSITTSDNQTIEEYVTSLLEEGGRFDGWYLDVSYETKLQDNYVVTGKLSLYGRVINPTHDDPVVDPTPDPIKLDTPSVTVNESGVASWGKIANATMYKYQITGEEEKTTTSRSVSLSNGQSIKVKAIGDGTNYSDSDYSQLVTYKAAPADDLVGDVDGDGVLSEVEKYYASAYNLTGDELKKQLHKITESTHTTKLVYTDNSLAKLDTWRGIKVADKGSKDGTVICIYTGVEYKFDDKDGGSGSNLWNREHLWAKAKGFDSSSYQPHNDIHHLFASEKNINNTRANKDFGEVTSGSSDKYGNKWTSTMFEPRDEVKGDIARALLYMVVRYDGDTCSKCSIDLELVAGLSTSYNIVNGSKGYLGDLKTLIKWHYEDPVSEKDLARNEAVYGIQGNRNPFIDHPEYVLALYPEYASQYVQ